MAAVCRDPAGSGTTSRERAMLSYAERLTRLSAPMSGDDLVPLRRAGLSDEEIRDLTQVVGYFNYVNRHVEGLGVELEADHPGRKWAEIVAPG